MPETTPVTVIVSVTLLRRFVLPLTVKSVVIVTLLTDKLAARAKILAEETVKFEDITVLVPPKVLFPAYEPFLERVSAIAFEYAVPAIVAA